VGRDPRQFKEERQRWTLDSLRRVCEWLRLRTEAGLSRLLRRLGISYKRARQHVHSPDSHYLAKLRDVQVHVKASKVDPKLFIVLFQDEFTYYRQPTLASAYEVRGCQQPLAELSHGSNLHWRVTATLDIWTGRVIYSQHKLIGLKELVAFYQKVCAAYPSAQRIYMVQDNWPVHYHPDVVAALQPQLSRWPLRTPSNWPTEPRADAPRLNLPIQLVPLPTYASWTNPIEKLWRMLRQQELHLHNLADNWSALKQRVSTFLDQFAQGSQDLLRYVGLRDPDRLYRSALSPTNDTQPLRC